MLALIPINGLEGFFRIVLLEIAAKPNCTVHLFSNLPVPYDDTVIGDLTECNFGGYAPQTMPAAIDAGPGVDSPISYLWDLVTFTATGPLNLPQVAMGYWIQWVDVTTSTTYLLWCQQFDQGVPFTVVGSTFSFQPSLGLNQAQV